MADPGSSFINALTAGQQSRLLNEQFNQIERRKGLAPDVQAAIGGDSQALGRIAAVDPDYAIKIGPILETMDAKQRAGAKAAADYTYSAANAMLQAPPAERPALYKQLIAQGRAQGFPLKDLPEEYTPAMDPWLRTQRMMAVSVQKQWEVDQDRPQPMGGPTTSAPTAAPAGGGVNPNNIGNVRPVGATSGFQQPPTIEDGVRLAVNNVKAYPGQFNNGQPMSLLQIGERWAPRGDGANDPVQWAKNVASIGGLPVDQPLDFNNPQVAAAFARGVHGAEKGANAVQPVQFYQSALTGGGPSARDGTTPVTQGDANGAQPATPRKAITSQDAVTDDLEALKAAGYVKAGHKGQHMKGPTGGYLYMNPVPNPDGSHDSIEYKPKPNQDAWEDVRNPAGQIVGQRNKVTNEFKPVAETGEKPPAGYRKTAEGGLEFIPGGPADPSIAKRSAPMNNEQARDAGFADRMANSNQIIGTLEKQGTKFFERVAEKLQGPTGTSYGMSDEYQQFKQAKADFINAQLRRESGAAISADEFKKADAQYFPQPGDSDKVIAQKALNRKLALEAMVRGAGPTYKPSDSIGTAPASTPPSDVAAPQAAPPDTGRAGLSMPRLSPEDAAKLPPGTPFIGQDGIPRVRK
jgi:hypothetical protein